MMASDIQAGTAFSCSGNQVTIDLTALNSGQSVCMRSLVSPVNPVVYGLVGWWKLDDASGTSATDSSGNGNAGTLTNGPAW